MDIDIALKIFKEYKSQFSNFINSDISETDTRCKVLDKIFIDVLGWSEDNIKREGYVQGAGYFDYIISTGLFHFVAEAKKSKVSFKLPKAKRVKLNTLITDKDNEQVIAQIRNYLTEKGLAIGVIANGHQFIIAQFVNFNGEDWKNNKAIIFDGFEDIESRFIDFYELLSYENVSLRGRVEVREKIEFSKKVIGLSRLRRKNEKLIRNELSDKLIKIIDVIFKEINNTVDLEDFDTLTQCYVFNKDVQKHHSEMSVMFQDAPPKFDERISPIRNTVHTHEAIENKLLESNFSLPNPIVLIGGKGSGKTTFLNYFFKVSINESTKKKIPSVYIDFRGFDKSDIESSDIIYQYILDKLYSEHPALNLNDWNILLRVYKKEIKQKSEKGIWSRFKNDKEKLDEKISDFLENKISNPKSHLKAISEYLISPCHKRLCIVFDNVDQLEFSLQKEAFLLSQSIHISLKCIIIISLREGYYYQWKDKPPFDAYQPNIFHITAPSYRKVLKKRIQYVVDNHEFKETSGKLKNKTFKLSDEIQLSFFKNLYKTLFLNKNSEILEFLEQTSYPNIRLGLDKFNDFLISGHSKVESYVAVEDYVIPVWEFIKSVALESGYYYRTHKSKVYNLFYPSTNSTNHFLKIRILFYLLNEAEHSSYREYYIPTDKLMNDFLKCGYNKDVILEELSALIVNGLVNSETYISDVENDSFEIENMQITITQSGMYYVTNLTTKFYYLQLIAQDTPIYNADYYDKITQYFKSPDSLGKRLLYDRVKFVENFILYLEYEESKENLFTVNSNNKALSMSVVEYIRKAGLAENLKQLNNKIIGGFEVELN